MNIKSRESIHREDRIIKTNTVKTTKRETKKIYLDANKGTPIRRERSKLESVADKFDAIHGSQEYLKEEITHETEHSSSTSFENKIANTNESFKSSNQSASENQSGLKPKSQQIPEQAHGNKCLFILFITAFICLGLGYFLSGFISSAGPKQELHCSFNDLKNIYPNQNPKLWKCLEFAIDDILNERINKPSVTLFVHKGSKRAKQLIRDIANTSSNCMDSSMDTIEFRSSDFTSEDAALDYGVIIDKYKKTAKEGNVVMIANLNEIPAKAARALHAICDRESPIFRKVVILLSLTAEYNQERPIDIAVNALHNLWEGKIMENELGPLLTRVTDEVILLQSK